MVVSVYARHSGKRPQSKVKSAGQYRRCKCPLWLRWGKSHKRSARTRSWEIATKVARKLEEELEREALGIEVPKPPDHVTIDAALELYLVERSQRGIKDSSKERHPPEGRLGAHADRVAGYLDIQQGFKRPGRGHLQQE